MIEAPGYRFTLEQYERLVTLGVLREDERLELLEGKIHAMSPIGPGHAYTVSRLTEQLMERLGKRAVFYVQSPIRLPPHSEPQPDLALLRPPADSYRTRLPEAADVLLLIEVADSALDYDRAEKLPLYAQALIPEVWLVNLRDVQLEVYAEPRNGRYGRLTTFDAGHGVAPAAFPGEAVDWWT